MKFPRAHLSRCARISQRGDQKRQKWKKETQMAAPHYPAWRWPALKYLYEERKNTASGHETTA